MILTIDVQYEETKALAAGLIFSCWEEDDVERVILKQIPHIEPYEPGQFYKRELPCILEILAAVDEQLDCIVIDGFVTLGSNGKAGLGMHLYHHLDKKVPVIGVAKKAFQDTPKECEVIRGSSAKPLFVTAVGYPLAQAKLLVENMHGNNRIPTLLKKVDQLCRGIDV